MGNMLELIFSPIFYFGLCFCPLVFTSSPKAMVQLNETFIGFIPCLAQLRSHLNSFFLFFFKKQTVKHTLNYSFNKLKHINIKYHYKMTQLLQWQSGALTNEKMLHSNNMRQDYLIYRIYKNRAGSRPRPKAPLKNKIFLEKKDPIFYS